MFKLQVMVSEELLNRIDELCNYIGSSRSSVCATIIAQSIPEWEKIYSPKDSKESTVDSQLKIQ